jgi:hypothetical protein
MGIVCSIFMNKNYLNFPSISKGEYLDAILRCIPSHIILFKILTGIGATTLEIEYLLRNSIIVELNLPVIKGKCKKYNTSRSKKRILGVYEGISVDAIIEYLESDVQPKKILTTPESYGKVQQAFAELGIDIYTHSFMLFDECEKVVQDVGYRSKVTLPINDFFLFKEKAFISATPIVPSDPRFALQKFKQVYIKPDFDFKQDLMLVHTNNTHLTFAKFIKENPKEQYFVFFNSTDSIASLVKALNIVDESAIFCAKESKNKLKVNGFKNLSIDIGTFHKYNFFTSRFFSAVDIDGIVNPTVIIISDLVSALHSTIDPKSEAVQIVGRFREVKGISSVKQVLHITNTMATLHSKSENDCLTFIRDTKILYDGVKLFLESSTSIEARDALKEMLTLVDFAKYVNQDGSINYFMQDNTVFEEKIKGYYQTFNQLIQAYSESNHFNIYASTEEYEYTDWDRVRTDKADRLKTVFEVIMPVVKEMYEKEDSNNFLWQLQLDFLKKEFSEVFTAFNKLGLDACRELGFDHIKIRKAIQENELSRQRTHFGFLRYIQNNFKEGEECSSQTITTRLKKGLDEYNLKMLTPNLKLLRNYCLLSDRINMGRINGKEVRGYIILEIYNNSKI